MKKHTFAAFLLLILFVSFIFCQTGCHAFGQKEKKNETVGDFLWPNKGKPKK